MRIFLIFSVLDPKNESLIPRNFTQKYYLNKRNRQMRLNRKNREKQENRVL